MRRLVSVFKRDRSDSHQAHSHKTSNKRATLVSDNLTTSLDSTPSTPQLSADSGPSHSSASSTGSADLHTPEDFSDFVHGPGDRKHWVSWFGKRSGTIKGRPPDPVPDVVQVKQKDWHPTPPPLLHPPPPGHHRNINTDSADEDEDDTSSASDESSTFAAPALTRSVPNSPATAAKAKHVLLTLTQNSIRSKPSSSPLFTYRNSSLYPRSCNPPHCLPCQDSMLSTLLKNRIIRRLSDDQFPLSEVEIASILPFSTHSIPAVLPSSSEPVDIHFPGKHGHVAQVSEGVRRWMSRPCFEDRHAIWLPTEGVITYHAVAGPSIGVAALEYSEALEAIGATVVPTAAQSSRYENTTVEEPLTPSSESSTSNMSLPHVKTPAHPVIPSPLRQEHNTMQTSLQPSANDDSLPSEALSDSPREGLAAQSSVPVKRGVRFAEDDKDDIIPIGYALRRRKQREEKAKFLREEQERRALEAEKAKVKEERMKMELERQEWERERRAWEMERKAAEDEKKQRLYAEEVAAARQRREAQRSGFQVTSRDSLALPTREPNRNAYDSLRHSRPAYDDSGKTRRFASESAVPTTSSSSHSPHSSSPASSRPPSINSGSPRLSAVPSLPPSTRILSTYSASSAEDVRLNSSLGKRASMASISSSVNSSPLWTPVSPNFLAPPVPAIPVYALDMPLLPPTAPFMLQQFPRSRSNDSSSRSRGSPSSSPSRHSLPSNHSSERLSSSPNTRRTPSSPQRISHQRRGSGDAKLSSMNPHSERGRAKTPASQSQPNSISRGRAAQSSQSSLPSPWTALPSGSGLPVTSMPHSSPKNNVPSSYISRPIRRQTAII